MSYCFSLLAKRITEVVIKKLVKISVKFFVSALLFSIKPLNAVLIKIYSRQKIKHQPIFIIGAPRTGSTILYQALTNNADVLYIDNLVCCFRDVFFVGHLISQFIFRNKAHNSFSSCLGSTRSSGLRAPSECGAFWYRWLPRDRHFIDWDDLDKINVKEIREEITAVSNYFDKPIVFKNLNAGQRLRLINKMFPDAKFIFLKRNKLATAQSILKAKRNLNLRDNLYWSVMPKNVDSLKDLSWHEQIVGQIFFLETQIVTDLELFPKDNSVSLMYEDLSGRCIEHLEHAFSLNKRSGASSNEISVSNKITLPDAEVHLLKEEILHHNWENIDEF